MGQTTRCPICRELIPQSAGPGRPRTYCSGRCRRQAERRARAARNWALLDSKVKAMVATDLEVVDLEAAAIPGFEVVDLDVEAANRAMSRGGDRFFLAGLEPT